ncbi:MAG: GNAT family N-acetyltransferase [Parvibaculaceae bacterium]
MIDIFVRVNRGLAPPGMRRAFDAYVTRSLAEEVGRIDDYYDASRHRSFWVATDGRRLLGHFGLEPADDSAVEVRRMYVDFPFRRQGIARAMLAHAEKHAQESDFERVVLSTSSLQRAALALYLSAGYELLREDIAATASLKTVGNGIRRFHFGKNLSKPLAPKIPAIESR